MAVAGLVLAAGGGTRFGAAPKQLADFHGRPLLEWAVRAQCEVAELSRVVVVLGSRFSEVRAGVEFGRAETVVCEEWESGQAWSLRRGVGFLSEGGEVAKVIVTLGDAPLVTPAVIRMFAGQPPRARAVYGGRPGHPVVLGPEETTALTSLAGDEGARGLLRGGPEVEVGHLCSGRDVDTPEDLEEVRDEARAVI
ncbi:MAG TPA: nucleotidyltransferase family protein [Solirubrobacteraceae bacterium]|nr:nucleotidyltransferase family protein [Solirubrobacteraceae bacterium]